MSLTAVIGEKGGAEYVRPVRGPFASSVARNGGVTPHEKIHGPPVCALASPQWHERQLIAKRLRPDNTKCFWRVVKWRAL